MVTITDWNDLDAVRDDLTASYTLANDLDSSTAGYAGIGDDWTKIPQQFSGDFDGAGYSIKDLIIDVSDSQVGMFAINDGGTIQNLHLEVDVTNTNASIRTGGLVGLAQGPIKNCVVDGSVTSDSDEVGCVAGKTGAGDITNCYALGDVSGDAIVGGLVGESGSTITTSYSAAAVSGNSNVGGFMGVAQYSDGETDCYWDTQASGQSTSDGTATGLTTSEMQGDEASTNMGGFDYTNTWDTVLTEDSDTSADGYPILQALDRATQLQAQGILVQPNPIIVDGVAYDVFVDGTQYSAELQ